MIEVTKNNTNYKIQYFEHMVHYKNLESIFQNGLLSHNAAYEKGLVKEDISMNDVQERRKRRKIRVKDKVISVHDFVSFYFNTRNPMLYKRRSIQTDLVILLVGTEILDWDYTIFTNGNAASSATKFFKGKSKIEKLPLDVIFRRSWNDDDPEIKRENVRKRCAEVLAYPEVAPSVIKKIICPNKTVYDFVQGIRTKPNHIDVTINQNYFFL